MSATKPDSTGVATLLNTPLGELLVTGLVKDPEDAGRLIAAAIAQAAAPVVSAKTPEANAEPISEAKVMPQSELRPDAKVMAAPASTPQIAK